MELSQCRECGEQLIPEANACPHCGATQQPRQLNFGVFLTPTNVGVVVASIAGVLIYDSILFWLPEPYSYRVYAIDWKEMAIGLAVSTAGCFLISFGTRRVLPGRRSVLPYGYLATTAKSVGIGLLLGLVSQLQINLPHWYTSNERGSLKMADHKEKQITFRFRVVNWRDPTNVPLNPTRTMMRERIGIIVAIVMALITKEKGFSLWLWPLAASVPGFIILLSLPSASANDIDEDTRLERRRAGNTVGAVLSVMSIVVGIGLIIWIRSP